MIYFVLQLWDEVNQISDSKVLEMKIADFNGKVSELWDALMGLELQLVDQLEVHMQQMIVMHSLQNQIQSSLSQLQDL